MTRRLHETRENVHRQMQEATTQSVTAAPSPALAVEAAAAQVSPATNLGNSTATPPAKADDHKNEFSQIVANLSQRSAERTQAAVPPPPVQTAPAVSTVSNTYGRAPASTGEIDERILMEAILRKLIEPAVQSWLDENLTHLVTETVREEIRKAGGALK